MKPEVANAILAMSVLAGDFVTDDRITGVDPAKPGADETRCSCGGLVRWRSRERRGYCMKCGCVFREVL